MLKIDDKNNNKNIIAYIMDTKDKPIHSIHLDQNYEDLESFSINKDYHTQVIPYRKKERDMFFIAGESGSGKSTYVKNYTLQYIKLFPNNPIYLISYLDKDETLDSIKDIKRLNWTNVDFMEEVDDINIDEFKDSMVIFDDVDSIPNKFVKKKIYNLLNKLLRLGRHSHTTVLFAGHELFMKDETKSLLNEASHIVVFPITIGSGKFDRLLDTYLGFSKEQIAYIKSIKTRSLTIMKGFPKVIIANDSVITL